MIRADFLKTLLAPFLAALVVLFPKMKGKVFKGRNAKMFINGVEISLENLPVSLSSPHEGDRAMIIGEWNQWSGEFTFDASLVEPIDGQTWDNFLSAKQ